MNPRVFCRERSYHKALLLTFSFDPVFFEQVVLPDLWAGRASDILILGDDNQITLSTQASSGQLWHLGKQYLLAGARHEGAFHPKVFLRLGSKEGLIMVGSGNVTSSGWGGNRELATAWALGPDHTDKGGWVHGLLDSVLSWCPSELEADAVRRMKDVPWLSLTPPTPSLQAPILHSWGSQTLSSAIANRWAGRKFHEIKILTGSTDESGAFLRWVHSTFGVTRATVALTPSSASFDPQKLSDLPLDLRVIVAPPEKLLHAKFYWLQGPEGSAAVMGSANCSAAAWLLPPNQGGNIETVVVYDTPSDTEFAEALTLFEIASQSASEVLTTKPKQIEDKQGAKKNDYRLVKLNWDGLSHQLHAEIQPIPLADMRVEITLGMSSIPMTRTVDSSHLWQCQIPEGIGSATTFAAVRVHSGDACWVTAARWVNDLSTLEHATQSARLLEPLKALERSSNSAEQRHILDEINEVAQALFNDRASFRDPKLGSDFRKDSNSDQEAAKPVNPQDLICHLEESANSPPFMSSHGGVNLSLTGILRLLFEAETNESSRSEAAIDEYIDEGALPEDVGMRSSDKKSNQEDTEQPDSLIEARFRERLANQIEVFLNELSSPKFAQHCTATQMVQAISFPLAVSLRGKRHGWVSHENAEKWALEIFGIFFRGSSAGGLLQTVEKRYYDSGNQSTFDEVVGDGALWLILMATLGNAHWRGIGTDIDKALALREVFSAPQLLRTTFSDRIATLLKRISIENAREYTTEIAPVVTRLLDSIEAFIRPIWKLELQTQIGNSIAYKPGDLLWRENVGWAICLADTKCIEGQAIQVRLRGLEKAVMVGYYVNVTELTTRYPELELLISKLRETASTEIRNQKEFL